MYQQGIFKMTNKGGYVMKKKRIAVAMLAATMALTSIPVFAATGTKTATLNNAQVSFNGGPVQTIQCYNIDGYNYVRARDITNNLNMYVMQIQNGNTGILINPTMPSESTGSTGNLTTQSAQVNVQEGQLIYDSMVYKAECFMLDNRFYFKLSDFAAASNYSLAVSLDLVELEGSAGIAEKPYADTYHGIEVTWDEASKVINVDRVETDLQKVFDAARGNVTTTTQPETNKEPETNNTQKPTETTEKTPTQNQLTSAPQVGTILADILIDDSKGAYLDSAMTQPNKENFTENYRYSTVIGQCTWYAAGRFQEVVGDVAKKNNYRRGDSVEDWVRFAASDSCPDLDGITDPYKIQPRSIAVFQGHALFVEWVDYDSQGNPQKVYFTEANTGHDGIYRPTQDGKVQVMDIDDFIVRQPFVGYIVVK